jgi:hypothetical protein
MIDKEGHISWVSPSPEEEAKWADESLEYRTRLQEEYRRWLKMGKGEDILPTWNAFVGGWMAYARIAIKEWPR